MSKDPIVEEIHRVRERLLEDCGGSLDKLMDRLKVREADDKRRIVSRIARSKDSGRYR